jgi:hypothetical protein
VHPVLFAFAYRLCSFMLISSRFVSHIFNSYRHSAYVTLITTEKFPPPLVGSEGLCIAIQYTKKKKGKIILRNDTLQLSRIVVHEVHNTFTVLFDSALYIVELFVEFK